jgi:hypothetical protein
VVGKRRDRGRSSARPDPFSALGLRADAGVDEIEQARRTLAKSVHPDVGGSVAEMQRINAAADEATRWAVAAGAPSAVAPAGPPTAPVDRRSPAGSSMVWQFDHPSFTVESLPVAAFEALLVVAAWIGETIDDDPPYRLDVAIAEPVDCWCRLDLVPDAGSTTVSLSVGTERGVPPPDTDVVRDAWIAGLNALDWAAIDDSPQPP